MSEENSNCLAGLACPECDSLGGFNIVAQALFNVFDDGTDDLGPVEWDDDAPCTCLDCNFEGVVADFRGGKPEAGPDSALRQAQLAAYAVPAVQGLYANASDIQDLEALREQNPLAAILYELVLDNYQGNIEQTRALVRSLTTEIGRAIAAMDRPQSKKGVQ